MNPFRIARWIAAGAPILYALNFVLLRDGHMGVTVIYAALFWILVAFALLRWPRKLGILIGCLQLLALYTQYKYHSIELANHYLSKGVLAHPILHWLRFWTSWSPLVLGGLCSILLRWLPNRDLRVTNNISVDLPSNQKAEGADNNPPDTAQPSESLHSTTRLP
jgi:hypothetical protein